MSDNVTSSCTLSGMLAHYGSNRFIQRPILVVLHVSKLSITLVGGSPANSVDMFDYHPFVSIKMIFKYQSKKAKHEKLSNTRPFQNIGLKPFRLRRS